MKLADFVLLRPSEQLRLIEDLQIANGKLAKRIEHLESKLEKSRQRHLELLYGIRKVLKPGHPLLKGSSK